MNLMWKDFIDALGEAEDSELFGSLVLGIGERPVISRTPDEYNDPAGETKFYKFVHAGIEAGIRAHKLNHLHFFMEADEGYERYVGPMINDISVGASEESIVGALGVPSGTGGGSSSPLLGFRHRWIRYERQGDALRFEFSRNGHLRKVSVVLI